MAEWVHRIDFTGPPVQDTDDPALDALIKAAQDHGWEFQGAIHSERAEKPWGNR